MTPLNQFHEAWIRRAIPGLSEEDQAIANDIFGFKGPDEGWSKILGDVVNYREEHGKLPSQTSADETVKKLGSWVSTQRAGKNLSLERRKAIMDQCPEILKSSRLWEQRLSATAAYLYFQEDLPSDTSADESVKKLGEWGARQRQSKSLTPERRAAIMESCPAIIVGLDPKAWEQKLSETSVYWRKNGSLPSSDSHDLAANDLGDWVFKQRRNRDITTERYEAINEKCPAILAGSDSGNWRRKLAESAEYLRQYGKLPSSASPDDVVKDLARWVGTQRHGKNLAQERRAAIMEQCPAILADR